MTHRQFLAWEMYYVLQWNLPTRDNWYQMQETAVIQRFLESFMEKPRQVSTNEFKMEFDFIAPEPASKPISEMTMEEYCQQARAVWRGALGIQVPPEEDRDRV